LRARGWTRAGQGLTYWHDIENLLNMLNGGKARVDLASFGTFISHV
jgi:hypothetical protein